ncbi:GntR family transcriptional regulator [Burkholderia sp. ABCPW 11]|uniref:GntR family transcriptional regulator n=1 Tax=Burkholderia sp. ABCPW 11 TaxID=1637859 RepID=UPI00075D7CA9|nr:GntR family transcriptional regulator [Burkholderia sp. ABCPW 11]KVD46832.1 GntR family transcriptional regulator [Burkholderia sp. ABCPW 11]
MSEGIGLLRPETLRHQVEHALRQGIMSGHFPPGSRLVERELCELLGVSRTSIREALRKLESEKLVSIVPHKGPVVAVVSKKEAAELYAIRALLEGYAAAEFARGANDDAIARLGECIRTLKASGGTADRTSILKAKAELYDVLLDNCGNSLAKEVLNGLYSRINLLRATSLMQANRLQASLKELDKLYRAIKARDPEAAAAAARIHVLNAETAAMRMLEAGEEGPNS